MRAHRCAIASPLSLETARQRLADALPGRRATLGAGFGPAGVVRGYVQRDRVKLVAMHAGLGVWSPTAVRGRLRATATGCVLDYSVGWGSIARVLGSVSLGAFLLVFAGGAAAAVAQVGHDGRGATGPAVVAAGGLAAALLFTGLAAAVRAAGRDQVVLLHSWLAQRLVPRPPTPAG
ncbi:hypothetical protein [Dactylosporangium matsuzakiense]|uniref:Uncharacterized protein n=1 Tax=Dactylosporangium matsuzakiense TaxID=53360 RepID=A0A9W6KW33_9ACTN|nr:hypothetical protein [Dactylosporangium matsuzakiense]UWZ45445.1 hypothetical protein Dmats_02540 [Dactylosporangium matsuzakiense]GLL08235.1 hypothetical protein GCM10017581_099960 [Dactylosporangium matsuzakiense]